MVGPFADSPTELYGSYAPDFDAEHTTTPYDGLSSLATLTNLASGCNNPKCSVYNQNDVINALTNSEIIFVCLGTGM